jgi:HEAT repeat protein
MRVFGLLLTFALAGACLGAEPGPAAIARDRQAEPEYQGKPLGYWIALGRNKHPEARRSAVAALGNMGPEARTAVPALTELLSGQDESLRAVAAKSLWRIKKGKESK